MRLLRTLIIAVIAASTVHGAARIQDGVTLVNDRPFFPLSCAGGSIEMNRRLGMNTGMLGAPTSLERVEKTREAMREWGRHGFPVTLGMGFGAESVDLWSLEATRLSTALSNEPNLLAWYVADDVQLKHIPSLRDMSRILIEKTPEIPRIADYYSTRSDLARETMREMIDIRIQYSYPVVTNDLRGFIHFFDDEREWVGDPLWTWIQAFQWENTAQTYGTGTQGTGALPTPEQIRLMSYIALNRGVRALIYYEGGAIVRRPEVAMEVALICREVGLFSEHLAAGTGTFDLATSDTMVIASAISYDGDVLIPVVAVKPEYGAWVDEGVYENVTIDCPWQGDLPNAMLIATPDINECLVERIDDETIRITVPSLDLAGFIYVTDQPDRTDGIRTNLAAAVDSLAVFAVPAAAAQARVVNGVQWQAGFNTAGAALAQTAQRSARAFGAGDNAQAIREWRNTLRECRIETTRLMNFVEARRELVPDNEQVYLDTPHGLHNIRGISRMGSPDDNWHFITEWDVVGPFDLDWDGSWRAELVSGPRRPDAPRFDEVFAPELDPRDDGPFDGINGPVRWRPLRAAVSGALGLKRAFSVHNKVFCYSRAYITAPRGMDAKMSLGSNDGAKVWINGEEVFAENIGRAAAPHQNEFAIHLREGENLVLVKIVNLGGDWQLYLSIDDPDRELTYTTE
jgi:hypothetical protein